MESLVQICSKNIIKYYKILKNNLVCLPIDIRFNLNLLFYEKTLKEKIKNQNSWLKLNYDSSFLILKKNTLPLFKKEGNIEYLRLFKNYSLIKYEMYSCFIFNSDLNYELIMINEYYNKNQCEYFFKKIDSTNNKFIKDIKEFNLRINKNSLIDGKINWFNVKFLKLNLNEYLNLKNPYVY